MRQYPTKGDLLKIADAAETWANTLRENLPLDGASAAENPALVITPADSDSNLNKKCLVRQLIEIACTSAAVRDLVADIEPADPLDGVPRAGGLRRTYPRQSVTNRTIGGWPLNVGRAIERLQNGVEILRYQIEDLHDSTTLVHLRDVQGIEWAVSALREAAAKGKRERISREEANLRAREALKNTECDS